MPKADAQASGQRQDAAPKAPVPRWVRHEIANHTTVIGRALRKARELAERAGDQVTARAVATADKATMLLETLGREAAKDNEDGATGTRTAMSKQTEHWRQIRIVTTNKETAGILNESFLMRVHWPSGAAVIGLYHKPASIETMVLELNLSVNNEEPGPPRGLAVGRTNGSTSGVSIEELRLTMAMQALETHCSRMTSAKEADHRDPWEHSALVNVPAELSVYKVENESVVHAGWKTTVWATSPRTALIAASWKASRAVMRGTAVPVTS